MERLIAFVATSMPDEARSFYRDVIGLELIEETEFSIVFVSGGTMLRVQKVSEVAVPPDTALGWEVDDMSSRIAELAAKGIAFERFDGMGQDEDGVWTTPDGTKVAWFRDPDGNRLSLTQFSG